MNRDELEIALYDEDGNVVLIFETSAGEIPIALRPDLADDLADRLKAAARKARASKPGSVQ